MFNKIYDGIAVRVFNNVEYDMSNLLELSIGVPYVDYKSYPITREELFALGQDLVKEFAPVDDVKQSTTG